MITRRFFCYLTFLILLGSCAQTRCPEECLSTISITDRNGFSETISNTERLEQYECVDFLTPQPYEKVLRVYHRDAQGNVKGDLITYHPNGQPMQHISITNGRAYGTYTSWHPNGTPHIQVFVIEGEPDFTDAAQQTWVFDGVASVWDDVGRMIAQIPYSKGSLEGESLYYHPSGAVWKTACFHRNLENGTRCTYLENGDLLMSAEYLDGVPHGVSRRYWSPDRLAAEERYENGRLQFGDYYDQNGHEVCSIRYGEGTRAIFAKDYIVEHRTYSGGELAGKIKVFSPEGFLLQIYHIRNGVKHGEDIEFYPQSHGTTAKISSMWIEGELHGTVKTWYPDGTQESQREMNNTQKDGVLMAWYRNGHLMLIEEYEKDNLLKGEYFRIDDSKPVSRVSKGSGTATLYDADGNLKAKVKVKNGKPVV